MRRCWQGCRPADCLMAGGGRRAEFKHMKKALRSLPFQAQPASGFVSLGTEGTSALWGSLNSHMSLWSVESAAESGGLLLLGQEAVSLLL